MIKAWSHNRIAKFEKCKYLAKLVFIDKHVDFDKTDLKPGQTEHPIDRGVRVHDGAERYVRGGVEMLPELKQHFEAEFNQLRELFAQGKVSLEGEWAVNDAWMPTAWMSNDTWGRLKLDAMVTPTPGHAVVIDYKTGKRSGNELKHAEQTQLYTVATLMRYPEIQRVTTELWYLDIDDLARQEFTREQGLRLLKTWNRRALAVTTATDFPPNPNKFSCLYCPFRPPEKGGNGVCPVGV